MGGWWKVWCVCVCIDFIHHTQWSHPIHCCNHTTHIQKQTFFLLLLQLKFYFKTHILTHTHTQLCVCTKWRKSTTEMNSLCHLGNNNKEIVIFYRKNIEIICTTQKWSNKFKTQFRIICTVLIKIPVWRLYIAASVNKYQVMYWKLMENYGLTIIRNCESIIGGSFCIK